MFVPAAVDVELDLAGHTCLALVTEGVEHGWAIGSLLAPDGDLGRIWTLSRSVDVPSDRSADRAAPRDAPGHGAGAGTRAIAPAGDRSRAQGGQWLARPARRPRPRRSLRAAGQAGPSRTSWVARRRPAAQPAGPIRTADRVADCARRERRYGRPLAGRERSGRPPVPRRRAARLVVPACSGRRRRCG